MISQPLNNLEGYLLEMMKPLIMNAVNDAMSNQKPVAMKSINNYLRCKEASIFISKSPNALRCMVCKGQIKSMKKGGSLYFLESDLIDYLESGRKKPIIANCDDVLVVKKNKG